MNTLRNKVQLIGNIGTKPEIRTLSNGQSIARFSLATNENYTGKDGEKVQETQWHNLIAWGKQAKLIEKYLCKGQEIAIEGKISTRTYEDKSGSKRTVTEIVISDLLMLGKTK